MRPVILTCCLVACGGPASTAPSQDLGWLVGTWSVEREGVRTTERWHALDDGSLLGSGDARVDDRLLFAETMAIVDRPEGRALVAWPLGQAPTTFPVVAAASTSVTFANAAHDFPQRIAYVRSGQDTLEVRATGVSADGAPREQAWTLTRAP